MRLPSRATDLPLKVLFRTRPQDLLPLTGDDGARVLSARVLELQSARRTVDLVLRLRAGSQVYLRHLEFQDRHRPDVLLRAFGYNAQLSVQTRLPVVTTIVYVSPPAPRTPVYTVALRGREWNRWRFDALHLWRIDAHRTLTLGPGAAALVPLMKGHDLALLSRAAQRIRAVAPVAEQPDLLAILKSLAETVYTPSQLSSLVERKVLMQSSFWREAMAEGHAKGVRQGLAKGLAQGRAAGRAEGRLLTSRKLCVVLARRAYPEKCARLVPMIERCTDLALLQRWILNPARLAAECAPARPVAHRAPRALRRTPSTQSRAAANNTRAKHAGARKSGRAAPARRSA